MNYSRIALAIVFFAAAIIAFALDDAASGEQAGLLSPKPHVPYSALAFPLFLIGIIMLAIGLATQNPRLRVTKVRLAGAVKSP